MPGDLLVGRSVSEWEALYALELDPSRCRRLNRLLPQPISDKAFADVTAETAQPFNDLIALLDSKVDSTPLNADLAMTVESYKSSTGAAFDAYMDEFKAAATWLLQGEVDAMERRLAGWKTDSFGRGISGDDMSEMVHHYRLAADKVRTFQGRAALVARAVEAIERNDCDNDYGVSLSMIGVSGAGKTAMMSVVAQQMTARNPGGPPVIVRYCGTSAQSMTGLQVIRSIIIQIHFIYGIANEEVAVDYRKAVKQFQDLLERAAVVIFIDSLDHLLDENEARSKLYFLVRKYFSN